LGTILPIVFGMLFMHMLGSNLYPEGLSAGFSLAPTSVGISLTLLTRAKQLNSKCGQIIMSSAFLDDIYSIICLVVMINLASGNFDPVPHVVVPMLSSFALVGFGVVCSLYANKYIEYLLDTDNFPWLNYFLIPTRSMNLTDEVHLFWMLLSYLLLSWLGNYIGSALLGCFTAGMIWSQVPRSHLVWEQQFKRLTRWLLRIFFSCTVAFTINISSLMSAKAFWQGLVLASIPCLGAKIMSGFFLGEEKWIVGVGMMARGEFAYLVAEEAHSLGRLSNHEYSVVIWALLWATMLAPMAFQIVLKKYVEAKFEKDHKRADRIGGSFLSGAPSFIIHFFASARPGMVRSITDTIHDCGLDIKKSRTQTRSGFCSGTYEVFSRKALTIRNKYGTAGLKENSRAMMKYKMATDFDDDKLDEIGHHLEETLFGDADAEIIFAAKITNHEDDEWVAEIELYGGEYMVVLDQITQYLHDSANLQVTETKDHEHSGHKRTSMTCEVIKAAKPLTTTSTKVFKETREAATGPDGSVELGRIVPQVRSSFFDGGPLEDDGKESIYEGRQAIIRTGIEEIFEKNGVDSNVSVFIVAKNSLYVGGRKAGQEMVPVEIA